MILQFDRNNRYSGQILAVVLVIIVVGVIIALAVMSRTFSNSRRVAEERQSADSLQIADTVLDSVKDISTEDLALWASEYSLCSTDDQGSEIDCVLDGLKSYEDFTAQFQLQEFYDSVKNSMIQECGYEDENSTVGGFKLVFDSIGADDDITIEKDSVFAFVPGGVNPPDDQCEIQIDDVSGSGDAFGVIFSPLYTKVDGNGMITDYKDYDFEDIRGICSGNCTTEWGNWESPGDDHFYTARVRVASGGENYNLHELRVKPVGSDVTLRRSYSCDMVEGNLINVQAIINCAGTSRGKQFILSDREWAPAIFDYVLFNGQGTLQNR